MNAGEILDALGVEPRTPDLGFLRELFDAFHRRVPFESASKIVRDAEVDDPGEKPRDPEVFWRDHLDLGAGGTCFARVAAFSALTESVGFAPVMVLGGITGPRNHASALYALGGRTYLADTGYPLPVLLPLESGTFDTAVGSLEFAVSGSAAVLRFASGPEAGRVIDFSLEPAPEDEFRECWRKTFSKTSLFLREVVLRKEDGHRVLRFFRGAVDVTDAHSRARIPLAGPRAPKLAGLFGIDEDLLARALAIAGDPDAERPTARVEAYGEGSGAEDRLRALSTPGGYRGYLAGLGAVDVAETGGGRWRATVRSETGETSVEEVELRPDGVLFVRRERGLATTGFALDRSAGEARLVRFADLPDAREDFLRVDAGRGRIAGILLMDLLAVARL